MNKFLYFFIMSLVFYGCKSSTNNLGDRIVQDFYSTLPNHWVIVGTGGAGENGKTKWIEIAIITNQKFNVAEGRRLIVQTAYQFLKIANSKEGLDQYFLTVPLGIDVIEIDLLANQNETSEDALFSVSLFKKNVMYLARDKKTNRLEKIHMETFEEAEKIVAEENKN